MIFDFYLKTVETIVTSHRTFQKAKMIQSGLHFFLNQPTRRAGNLHPYITLASSLLILR